MTRRPDGPPRSTAPPSERHQMIRLRFSRRQWNQLIALAEAAGVSPTVCAKRIVSDHLRKGER